MYLVSKNVQPIASTCREQSANFFANLYYPSFRNSRVGGRIDLPPAARPRYEIGRAWARVKSFFEFFTKIWPKNVSHHPNSKFTY